MTYVFNPTMLLDANFGLTHQVLGAEAPDIGVNIGSDADKMNIPGHQRSGPPAGRPAELPDRELVATSATTARATRSSSATTSTRFSVNLQKQLGSHRLRGGLEWLDQQINHFQPQGGTFQTVRGTFIFNGQSTMLQNAPAPADTRFNSWAAFLLGLPSQAGKVDQLLNPNSIYMKTWAGVHAGHVAGDSRPDAGLGLRWEHQTLADAGPTAWA